MGFLDPIYKNMAKKSFLGPEQKLIKTY